MAAAILSMKGIYCTYFDRLSTKAVTEAGELMPITEDGPEAKDDVGLSLYEPLFCSQRETEAPDQLVVLAERPPLCRLVTGSGWSAPGPIQAKN